MKKEKTPILSVDEQIKKLKRIIKFIWIFFFIWSAIIITASVLILVYTPIWELGVGFLIMLPFSIGFGLFWQISYYNKEIAKLSQEQAETIDSQIDNGE